MRFGPYTNFDGTLITDITLSVRALGDAAIDSAGNVTAAIGLPLRITLGANGMATNTLQPQNYFVTNALGGPAYFNKGYVFRAPLDSGPTIYSTTAPGILISGMNYFITLNGATNGSGSITFNSVTNGLGYTPVDLAGTTNVAVYINVLYSNSLYSTFNTALAGQSVLGLTNAFGTNAAGISFSGGRVYISTNYEAPGAALAALQSSTNFTLVTSNGLAGQITVGAITSTSATNLANAISGVVGTNGAPLTLQFTSTGTNAVQAMAQPGINTASNSVLSIAQGRVNTASNSIVNGSFLGKLSGANVDTLTGLNFNSSASMFLDVVGVQIMEMQSGPSSSVFAFNNGVRMGNVTVSGNFTNSLFTAGTLLLANGNKVTASLANGAGLLRNDGTGGTNAFSWDNTNYVTSTITNNAATRAELVSATNNLSGTGGVSASTATNITTGLIGSSNAPIITSLAGKLNATSGAASGLSATNTSLLGNVAFGNTGQVTNFVATTNVVAMIGAGSAIANPGAFLWNSSLNLYTNWTTTAVLTNTGSSWLLKTNAVTLYSLSGSSPFGTMTVVNGAAPAPVSVSGWTFSHDGMVDFGFLSQTNILAMIQTATNGLLASITNGTSSGSVAVVNGFGTNTTLTFVRAAWGLSNSVGSDYSSVLSGTANAISGFSIGASLISGGVGNGLNSPWGFIGGGAGNNIFAGGGGNSVVGGLSNTMSINSSYSAILGGYGNTIVNTASGNFYSSFIGGLGNIMNGDGPADSFLGGMSNRIKGAYGTVGGRNANITNDYNFIWSDGTLANSQTNNQFSIAATNGTRILVGPLQVTNLNPGVAVAAIGVTSSGVITTNGVSSGIVNSNSVFQILTNNSLDIGGLASPTTTNLFAIGSASNAIPVHIRTNLVLTSDGVGGFYLDATNAAGSGNLSGLVSSNYLVNTTNEFVWDFSKVQKLTLQFVTNLYRLTFTNQWYLTNAPAQLDTWENTNGTWAIFSTNVASGFLRTVGGLWRGTNASQYDTASARLDGTGTNIIVRWETNAQPVIAFTNIVSSGGGGGGGGTPLILTAGLGNGSRAASSGNETNGFQFTLSANKTATDLGRWVKAGNSHTHVLVLVDTSTCTEMTRVTVNTSGATTGDWLYGSITPTALTAGHTYGVYSEEDTTDLFYIDCPITYTGDASSATSAYIAAGNCQTSSANQCYGPVNIKLQ